MRALPLLLALTACAPPPPPLESEPPSTKTPATEASQPLEPEVSEPASPSEPTPASYPEANYGLDPIGNAAAWEGVQKVAVQGGIMGTTLTMVSFTTPELDAKTIEAKMGKAIIELQRLQALMTTWEETSEISRVNAQAGGQAVEVSPESMAVVLKSQWISSRSEGVFDISFDAMHGLWKFDEDREAKIPPKDAVERARKLIDYRKIEVDEKASTLRLAKKGMRINLGGIAKGYGVDRAAEILKREGIESFIIQAGGDLYVAGTKPDGSRYRVGVRDPRGSSSQDFFALIEVEDHAFSTAGDYERAFILDGKRYHHIIDPRTGYPATASRSVTVWAKDALTADAIDDAVFILGVEKGMALVESIPDCGAVIVDKDNNVHISQRLQGKVTLLRAPSPGT